MMDIDFSTLMRQGRLSTPNYIYDADKLAERYTRLKQALGTPVIVSLKANPSTDLLLRVRHLFEADGIEVASLGELNAVARATTVYINNPSLDERLIKLALAANCRVIVDSLAQLEVVLRQATPQRPASVLLRLNWSALQALTPVSFALREDHFGMDWPTLQAAAARLRDAPQARLLGAHLFCGSHSAKRMMPIIAATVASLAGRVEQAYGHPIELLNLGGGFSEHWEMDSLDFAGYRTALTALPQHIQVLHEAGRALFSSCGYFVTRVVATKSIDTRRYAICDGGMNQNFLLAQTENPLRRYRRPKVLRDGEVLEGSGGPTKLVGSTCSRDDVIGVFDGPELRAGDLCIFDACGAYCSTYTVARFLSLPEAKEYVHA